jgi:hypothetical protein
MSADGILHGLYRHRGGRMVRIDAPPAPEPSPSVEAPREAPQAPSAPAPEPIAPIAPSHEFNPGEHSVADVLAYMAAHPERVEAVLDAERAGKNRKSVVG